MNRRTENTEEPVQRGLAGSDRHSPEGRGSCCGSCQLHTDWTACADVQDGDWGQPRQPRQEEEQPCLQEQLTLWMQM